MIGVRMGLKDPIDAQILVLCRGKHHVGRIGRVRPNLGSKSRTESTTDRDLLQSAWSKAEYEQCALLHLALSFSSGEHCVRAV